MSHYNLFATTEDGLRPNAHEAEAYHDMLEEIIKDDEFWNDQEPETQQAMLICRDCMCWVLGHDNEAVAANLAKWADAWRNFNGYAQRFDN